LTYGTNALLSSEYCRASHKWDPATDRVVWDNEKKNLKKMKLCTEQRGVLSLN